ncbi:cytochrome P450 4c21-like [Macrosteles quadrilineatus]|uniref:cytochrome P450 4c21-like n=1 Tax=Macrosteles quadrilineatus TaxID=74068 RepID=UPI0023E293C3|nr:cytochrome P450 4c21-like [Macrosteles quadrilineatus]
MLAALVSVLTTLIVYFSLLFAAFWIWFQWRHRDLLRVANKLPVYLPTVPLLGHAYLTFKTPDGTARKCLGMTVGAMLNKGWKTVVMWVGPLPLIVVGDMDDLQTIFNGGQNTADKPEEYDYFVAGLKSEDGPLRQNLLSARGQTWKLTRKHLNPMFHPQNVQHMISVFNMNSRELVERMNEHVGLKSFDVMHYTMDLALKTICNLIYGPDIPIDVHSESFKGLMKVVERIPELFVKRLLKPWLRIEWIFQWLYKTQINRMQNSWRNFTEPLLKIAKEKKLQKTKKYKGADNTSNESEELLDMLDAYSVLQQKHPEFSEADMLCEMLTLYCTGTDTVGSTTASCMLALAQFPHIQDRLYNEIISIVGLNDDITLEDLSRMPYLDQVIKETMRKFLIVPFVLRKMSKDVELKTCTLPAGSVICCNLANIHMDPKVYPNPDEFDPDRFSPENSCGKEKFSFIPFSGGPRMCIAKNYAMNLMKIQIAHVLRNFRLSTSQSIDKMKRKLIVTLVSTEGYNIRVEKRFENRTGFHRD